MARLLCALLLLTASPCWAVSFGVEVMTNLVDGGDPAKLSVGDLELDGDVYRYKVKYGDKEIYAGKSRGMIGPELAVVDFDQADPGRQILLRETNLSGGAHYDVLEVQASHKAKRVFTLKGRGDPEFVGGGTFFLVEDGPFWTTKQRYVYGKGKLMRVAQSLYRVEKLVPVKEAVDLRVSRSAKSKVIDSVEQGATVTILGYASSSQKCAAYQTVKSCDWLMVKTPRNFYGWLTITDAVKHFKLPK